MMNVDKISNFINKAKKYIYSDFHTEKYVTNKILMELGYDITDSDEVNNELSYDIVGSFVYNKNKDKEDSQIQFKLFIQTISITKHMVGYHLDEEFDLLDNLMDVYHPDIIILTNGIEWWFYPTEKSIYYSKTPCLKLNLLNESDIKELEKISKDNIDNFTLDEYIKEEKLNKSVESFIENYNNLSDEFLNYFIEYYKLQYFTYDEIKSKFKI